MDGLLNRIQALEQRTRTMEGQLRTWRIAALALALVAVGGAWVLPGQAQQVPGQAQPAFGQPGFGQPGFGQPGGNQPGGFGQPGFATGTKFTAPFVVIGANGAKLLEVTEFIEKAGDGSQDALLTLFRNGRPAVMYRTTGKLYKDAYDTAENYLNVVETWLYRYPRDNQGKIDPTPYLASSTALTRAGGSIAVFSEQGAPTTTPPMAARLSSKRGSGGVVMLYDNVGNEGRVIQSGK